MKKTWIIIVALVIVVAAVLYVFSIKNKPTQQLASQNATSTQAVATSTNNETTTTPGSSSATSSASAKVGPFTVVLNCHDLIPGGGLVAEDSIGVYKGNSLIQTITPQRGSTMQTCSSPEVVGLPSQDLSSGNSLYFMIDISHGQSVTYSQYWVLNSSTQQFYCPTGNACILQD